jgi:hypothetical protein
MVSLIYLIGFGLSGVMISSRYFDPPKVLLTLFAVSRRSRALGGAD